MQYSLPHLHASVVRHLFISWLFLFISCLLSLHPLCIICTVQNQFNLS
jgi:hypothetical protein